MDVKAISDFIHSTYGISGDARPLEGYMDRNFLLIAKDGTRYIVKLSSEQDSTDFLHSQNKILERLQSSLIGEYSFPTVIPSLEGQDVTSFKTGDNIVWNTRLLSFVEGNFLAEITPGPELMHNLGVFLGKMDRILSDTDPSSILGRKLVWDLQHFSEIEDVIDSVDDVSLRTLIHYYLVQFITSVESRLRKLRKQVIHSDANDWNILAEKDNVAGIIDFGDMVYSQTINELAISITYAMMDKEEPIDIACEIIRGYHSEYTLERSEIEILYYLIAARLCISICMSELSRKKDPGNKYLVVSEKPAIELLRGWIEVNPVYAENRFYEACGFFVHSTGKMDTLIEKRRQNISNSLILSYVLPVRMEKAALQYMYDADGNTYLDCVNNICHVGHCHPKVVAAAQAQIAALNTNTRYLYESLTRYAEKLCAAFPAKLNKVFFVNSGSAATDLALRLARTYTQREDVIVVDHAYHGNTISAIEISPYKYEGAGGTGKAASTHKAVIPDTYRGKYRRTDPDAGVKYANDVRKIVGELDRIGGKVAAFICESIIGCGGQVMLPKGYLKEVYRIIRENGGVCIADEVQVGFGRIGKYFWGFELQNVVPDIVILGKPMGNGHPLAAVVTTKEINTSFENGMEFFSSFGGNPVSCVIGESVLDVIREEKLQENALATGNYLIAELKKLQEKYPLIGDVRGSGFFLGIEFVRNPETLEPATGETRQIVEAMKERKILLSTDGPYHNIIKFKPPMVFSRDNASRFINNLEHVLKRK